MLRQAQHEGIIAHVETGDQCTDTRFIVTDLSGRSKALYEKVYCRRGAAENHIKAWKSHLAADRTSCTRAVANQFRLFLHAGAYWLLWGLRSAMPKRSAWRVTQFDTLRLRLIKIAARVVEMRTQIRIHLPTASPAQATLLPCPRGLPRNSGGSASTPSLSRPAQASLTLRPAGSLDRPRRPLSQGFDPAGCPSKPPASYQINRQLSGRNLPPLVTYAVGAH